MKLPPFNTLTCSQILHAIENRKRYTNFNTLGLYRSLCEPSKLSDAEKLQVREAAHALFRKSFDFLQIKDPQTYFRVTTLGESLTAGELQRFWENLRRYQEKVLNEKKISHRSFGVYSKHDCGYDQCFMRGVMFPAGNRFLNSEMCFKSDKRTRWGASKNNESHKERRLGPKIIRKELED